MKATVLVDNIAANGLAGEWGLSIYIGYRDKRILLDTGASDLFLKNAGKMGLSIEDVDSTPPEPKLYGNHPVSLGNAFI